MRMPILTKWWYESYETFMFHEWEPSKTLEDRVWFQLFPMRLWVMQYSTNMAENTCTSFWIYLKINWRFLMLKQQLSASTTYSLLGLEALKLPLQYFLSPSPQHQHTYSGAPFALQCQNKPGLCPLAPSLAASDHHHSKNQSLFGTSWISKHNDAQKSCNCCFKIDGPLKLTSIIILREERNVLILKKQTLDFSCTCWQDAPWTVITVET